MVNINDAYSGYLKAENLNGQAMNVTISHVEIKEFEDGKKGCVFFHGMEKGVLLNMINKNAIVEMFGPETDHWTNQTICLFPSTTEFRGNMVPCIRIRRPDVSQQPQTYQAPPAQAKPMPEPQHQDYNELNPPPRLVMTSFDDI